VDFFFARQPILDKTKAIFGYELLFRGSRQNSFNSDNGDRATLDILSNALFHASFQEMVGGKHGLVNFTRELLFSDVILLFPAKHFIVEVLEDVVPDNEVIERCKHIKELGYKLALDDFVVKDLQHPLLPLADIVKVDFLQSDKPEREKIARKLLPSNITLLAEKVETEKDLRQGIDLGFKLFQGYFFSKPIMRTGKRLAPSQISGTQLIQAVYRDPCDYKEVSEIISRDMSLAYRMLKLANSPFFGIRGEVTSILHAILLMGSNWMKRFVSIISIGTAVNDKPPELALLSLTRARIGEEIAPLIGYPEGSASLFLTGLFSLLDALLDSPMEEILAELPIAQDVKNALRGDPNLLSGVLNTIIAYEKADWDEFSSWARKIGLKESLFPPIYASSITWAKGIVDAM
jgi:c-di-GMP-related signal transduction protein